MFPMIKRRSIAEVRALLIAGGADAAHLTDEQVAQERESLERIASAVIASYQEFLKERRAARAGGGQ